MNTPFSPWLKPSLSLLAILLLAAATGCGAGDGDEVAQKDDPQVAEKGDDSAPEDDTSAPEDQDASQQEAKGKAPGAKGKQKDAANGQEKTGTPSDLPQDPPAGETEPKEPSPDELVPGVDPEPQPSPQELTVRELLPIRSRKIEAPPLDGGLAWINTAGPLDIKELRGKYVLLDFWTYCCINCLHILPELKKLEQRFPEQLVVIGVHSKKFDTEGDTENIKEAVLRYEIEHPVVNDANHAIWNRIGVRSWPTLMLIDPEGYVGMYWEGEKTAAEIGRVIKGTIPYFRQRGTLDETPLRFDLEAYSKTQTPLRFPSKVLADEAGKRLFITDSNHNRIVIADMSGKLIETIGSGAIGSDDGDYATATFDHPHGLALVDETLYVADTENHLLRKVDLAKKQVSTIAGTGDKSTNPFQGLDPETLTGDTSVIALNSPWALWPHEEHLYIAMAGWHQIWRMSLDGKSIGPYAGTAREAITDGALLVPEKPAEVEYSNFAQPSGLSSDGTSLFVADSEGSAIRAVPFAQDGLVTTLVGTPNEPGSLFNFGDRDGELSEARLQHALGVSFYNGKLYVADTYNNKVKVIDLEAKEIQTLAGTGEPGATNDPATFDEPAGLVASGGKLYVADTNNHVIRVIDLENKNQVSTLEISGLEPPNVPEPEPQQGLRDAKQIALEKTQVKAIDGQVAFNVNVQLPEGWKINPLAPMRYKLEAAADEGALQRDALGQSVKLDEPATQFSFKLPVAEAAGQDKVKVALTYYYCKEGSEGLCKVGSAVWTVPLEISNEATSDSVQLTAEVTLPEPAELFEGLDAATPPEDPAPQPEADDPPAETPTDEKQAEDKPAAEASADENNSDQKPAPLEPLPPTSAAPESSN